MEIFKIGIPGNPTKILISSESDPFFFEITKLLKELEIKYVGEKISMMVTSILGYYHVGDRCKSLEICLKMEKNLLTLAAGLISCLQHNVSVTNITFWYIICRLEYHQQAETCYQHSFLSPTF